MTFNHLKQTRLTYCQHFCHAWSMIGQLSKCIVQLVVHSFYPDVWVTHATDTLREIVKQHDDLTSTPELSSQGKVALSWESVNLLSRLSPSSSSSGRPTRSCAS